jgi:SulP family sulfate permease
MCSAVNEIDFSALESLEGINQRLKDIEVGFHLSEVKGPVTDRLARTDFLDHLNGEVFLSQYEAITRLLPDREWSGSSGDFRGRKTKPFTA